MVDTMGQLLTHRSSVWASGQNVTIAPTAGWQRRPDPGRSSVVVRGAAGVKRPLRYLSTVPTMLEFFRNALVSLCLSRRPSPLASPRFPIVEDGHGDFLTAAIRLAAQLHMKCDHVELSCFGGALGTRSPYSGRVPPFAAEERLVLESYAGCVPGRHGTCSFR